MNIESMKTTIVEAISKYRDFTEKNGQFIYRCIMSKWGEHTPTSTGACGRRPTPTGSSLTRWSGTNG